MAEKHSPLAQELAEQIADYFLEEQSIQIELDHTNIKAIAAIIDEGIKKHPVIENHQDFLNTFYGAINALEGYDKNCTCCAVDFTDLIRNGKLLLEGVDNG